MTRSQVRYKSCRISWTKCQMSWTPPHSWQSKHPSTLLTQALQSFFPHWSSKQKCLEIQEGYFRGWAEVLAGTKRKVFSLKVQLYKAIVECVKDMAEPFPASTPRCNLAQHRRLLGLAISQQQQQAFKPLEDRKGLGCSPQGRCRWWVNKLLQDSWRFREVGSLELHGHCSRRAEKKRYTVGKQRMCITPCSLPGGAG